jgi:hypothetical protein
MCPFRVIELFSHFPKHEPHVKTLFSVSISILFYNFLRGLVPHLIRMFISGTANINNDGILIFNSSGAIS